MHSRFAIALLAISAVAMTTTPAAQALRSTPLDAIAERYVKLVLALGVHDPNYVDAYYGPLDWKLEADRAKIPLAQIAAESGRIRADADRLSVTDAADAMVGLRREYLRRQIEALRSRVRMLSGVKMTFDEESRALYDAVAPTHPESYFASTLNELDQLLPGNGALIERYDAFRNDFVIPISRLSRVFNAAIAECRARTLKHVQLPAGEGFSVEYVTNKPWGGYNWYQGSYRSVIQINTDLPIYIDRAIDLACHEGYPGHHVYNALLEQHLVRERGWVEFSVYALFSPQSLIAEGTANYGIEVAFPGQERLTFERDVLFPEAGLNPARAAEYYKVQALMDQLAYAGNEAARRYLNGEIDRQATAAWLTRFTIMSPVRAEQRTRFFDQYRSYVINYNAGKDLVKRFIESRGGSENEPVKRWQEFVRLLASPRLPSGLN